MRVRRRLTKWKRVSDYRVRRASSFMSENNPKKVYFDGKVHYAYSDMFFNRARSGQKVRKKNKIMTTFCREYLFDAWNWTDGKGEVTCKECNSIVTQINRA